MDGSCDIWIDDDVDGLLNKLIIEENVDGYANSHYRHAARLQVLGGGVGWSGRAGGGVVTSE